MTTPAQALDRLTQTATAVPAVQGVHRQAIRDAHTAGASKTDITATLGKSNRNTINEILADTPPPAAAVKPTPVVFLRGPKIPADVWTSVITAMSGRGWIVVRDRTQAWHYARAGVPVVLVDMAGEPAAGLVQARMDGDKRVLPLVDAWTVVDELDGDLLALAVIDQLHTRPAEPEIPASAAPVALDPAEVDQLYPPPSKARSITISDDLWDLARAAIAGSTDSLRALTAQAVAQQIAGIQHTHNHDQPYPIPPAGNRAGTVARDTLSGTGRQIWLPETMWDQARAVVAAGHAPTIGHLINVALTQHLTPGGIQ